MELLTEGARWFAWPAETLQAQAEAAVLSINPLIYAEVSFGFARIEETEDALPAALFPV